jgi:hypothetical protein
VAGAFVLTDPPLFNPATWSDPAFYTGFWLNFHQLYHAFSSTYYASRLPWIIPGYALNAVLSPQLAHYVLHGTFFLAGGLAAYGLLRAHFGRNAALIGYVWLIGSQMTFGAQHWDYWDGALITFLLAGLYLGVPASDRPLPAWRAAAAGFFTAAAVVTNLYAIVLAVGVPILYAATRAERPLARFARRVARDTVSFLAGVAVLVGGCAAFAVLEGGPAWFLGPEIHAARAIDPALFRVPLGTWLPQSPRVLAPVFLALALLAALLKRRKDRVFRAALGSAVYLTAVAVFLVAWELSGGDLLESIYYFSPTLPAMTLCVGAIAACLGSGSWSPRRAAAIVGACAAAVLAPLLWIYLDDVVSRVGRAAYVPAAAAMEVALAAIVAGRALAPGRGAAAAAIAALVLACGASAYALDASSDVFGLGASTPSTREVASLGAQTVAYVRHTAGTSAVPMFWYDQKAFGGDYVGIQALYLYKWTEIGLDLPRFGALETAQLERGPSSVVLLCVRRACSDAAAVLRRHGFDARLAGARDLVAGSVHVWVEVYDRVQ